jgi:hypothetical protein
VAASEFMSRCRNKFLSVRHLWGTDPRISAGRATLALVGALLVALLAPATAAAHGPVNPAATSYLATVRQSPAGVDAKVVDGDQRMWVQADPRQTVVVLDYRGAPYVRFSDAGVQVNSNSSMYYLNEVPPELVPANIGPRTPPHWSQVSGGHAYQWHDGRLHALAATALAPGTTYVGRWTIPLRVDGRREVIAGGLRYAPNPSVVWFWPILVALACVFAGLRIRRREVDLRMARGLGLVALAAFTVAALGEQLHGRPNVSIGQLIVLALLLAFAAWALVRLVRGRHGWFGFFLIALAALFEGATLIGVLTHGFVLIALPPVVARLAVITCLAAGAALLPLIFRLAEQGQRGPAAGRRRPEPELEMEGDPVWEWDREGAP